MAALGWRWGVSKVTAALCARLSRATPRPAQYPFSAASNGVLVTPNPISMSNTKIKPVPKMGR